MMIRKEISKLIEKSIKNLQRKGAFSKINITEINIEHPEEKIYGDYSTNISFKVAKITEQNPIETAKLIKSEIENLKPIILEKIEVVKPGFINFFISNKYLQKEIKEILERKDKFGNLDIGKNKKVNVEFISANPTGQITIGNGRGAFCGDALSNVLKKSGYGVKREYYVNNMGRQILLLGHSILGDSEAVYKGKAIDYVRQKINTEGKKPKEIGQKGAKIILEKFIQPEIKKWGIKFDTWFLESDLQTKEEIKKVLNLLKKKKLTFKENGATWFKSKKFGDDKNRVLIRSDNKDTYSPETYFLSEILYIRNKFRRGFDYLIIFLGAEHHGYIKRLKAAAKALGYNQDRVRPIIMQHVRLLDKGKQTKMSKRGVFVTLKELVDEVGLDATRFFFLMRNYDSHLIFDLDLAKQQSEKNPVYYIQYAHARTCSILVKAKLQKVDTKNFNLLNHPSELSLIKQMIQFPEIIEDIAKNYQIQRIPQYAVNLATSFHQFYRDCQVLSKDREITKARLALVSAVKIILESTLNLMGIFAPEKM